MQANIILKDEVNIKIDNLSTITRKKLQEKFSFMLPHAFHVPAFKMGRWDGKVNFFTFGGLTYLNLLDEIVPLLIDQGYEVILDDRRHKHSIPLTTITADHFANKLWPTGHAVANTPVILRDYQTDAINGFITNPQSIQCIATGGGKTLITAALSNLVEGSGRTIVIVPSKSLVVQTEEDYVNLGLDVGVYFGDRKEFGKQHTICTWQSLASIDRQFKSGSNELSLKSFADDVIAVIVDECHGVKADKLKYILGNAFAHIPLRWGFTGTIPKEPSDKIALTSYVGPVTGGINASTLQDMKVLSDCKIHIRQLVDNVVYNDYQTEQTYLTTNDCRLTYLANYFKSLSNNKNSLILVNKIKTGQRLVELLDDGNDNVVFVSGKMNTTARKHEYDKIKDETGKIIIATYGVAAIGINLVRIHNVVLFEAGKSFIRVIQSIGRGLRRSSEKDFVDIYDITSNAKFSKRHLTARKKYYKEAEYDFSITKVDWR